MKLFLLLFAFAISVAVSELILIATAFAQSGAPTGTFVNPSVPNGVESNPQTFENVQPVIGSTPAPVPHLVPKHHLKGGDVKMQKQSFVSPPDTMEKETEPPEPKDRN